MAAPVGQYTPRSGPLAGQVFGSYYQYQKARAQELGFSGYAEQRRVLGTPFARGIFTAEKQSNRFDTPGRLTGQSRFQLSQIIREFTGQNLKDRRFGGPLDMFLRRLGRRVGNETWHPGETPDR